VRLNLLGILLTRGGRSVEVHDSVTVITAIATAVVVVSARGLLVVGLLVVVVAAEYLLVLLAELARRSPPLAWTRDSQVKRGDPPDHGCTDAEPYSSSRSSSWQRGDGDERE
jgi:hypothetical protein